MSTESIWQLAKTREQRRRFARLLLPDIQSGDHFDYGLRRDSDGDLMLDTWIREDVDPEAIPVEFRDQCRSRWGSSVAETPKAISRSKWQREEAAIWVLEAIGTEAALAIVERMAMGHPEAGPTIAAREVLARRVRK